MTVNTGHARPLMRVGYQLMIFNPVRPVGNPFGVKRRPVFRVKIMFESAVVIGADKIAVVTAQAEFVGRSPYELMGD